MSKAKGKDAVVRQGHMPRKNGPCKKAPDGMHVARVTRRETVRIIDARADIFSYGAREGWSGSEHVVCDYCGKKGMGGRVRFTDESAALSFTVADDRPRIKNLLDLLNEKHR